MGVWGGEADLAKLQVCARGKVGRGGWERRGAFHPRPSSLLIAPLPLPPQRSVEIACASLESLAVLHWARALQLLMLAAAELRRIALDGPAAATDDRGRSSAAGGADACAPGPLGISGRGLDALVDAASHMLALTQVRALLRCWPPLQEHPPVLSPPQLLRSCVAHARETYSALLDWLRQLGKQRAELKAGPTAPDAPDAAEAGRKAQVRG